MMSKNGDEWKVLVEHKNDKKLNEPGSVASWPIQMTNTLNFSTSGFEIYGIVQSVVFDSLKAIEIQKINNKEIPIAEVSSGSISNLLEKRKLYKRLAHSSKVYLQKQIVVGARVVRGGDWKWQNQYDSKAEGTVIGEMQNGWVEVYWDNDCYNLYRMGAKGEFDISLAPSHNNS
jgi:E3 ubiquitin-protein ligase HECTD1